MTRTLRLLTPLALIAMVALISACGSNAPAASGGSGGSSNTTAALEQGVRFAQCMRHNGVGNFPDPSGSGGFTIDAIANGSSLDTSSPTFTQAISACRSLEPAGFEGDSRTAQQQAAALRFAQCVRAGGVSDFPDAAPGQPLIDTNRIPSAATSGGMSILHAAMQKCSSLARAAGVHR